MVRFTRADVTFSYFGMENPVVGGYDAAQGGAAARHLAGGGRGERDPTRAAAARPSRRRASSAANTWGYEPAFKSEMSEYDLPRAKALLDTYGYVDKDGDGWRDQPDGQPLVLEYATQPDQQSRQLIEQWKRNMDALGLRIEFNNRQVAREPQGLARRQADDVGRGLAGRLARLRHLHGPGLWPEQGPVESRAIRPAGVQQDLRGAACAARRPRARGAGGAGQAACSWPTCPTRCTCTASPPT